MRARWFRLRGHAVAMGGVASYLRCGSENVGDMVRAMRVSFFRAAVVVGVCASVLGCNKMQGGGILARLASSEDPPAASKAPAKEPTSEPANGSSDGRPAWMEGYVANNQALINALKRIWIPDEKGELAPNARDEFEKELLRSVLYVNEGPGAQREADKIIVYTDEASVTHAEGPKAKAVPVPPGLVIEMALRHKQLLYVHYEEGNDGTSLFTALDDNMLPDLHKRAKASLGK